MGDARPDEIMTRSDTLLNVHSVIDELKSSLKHVASEDNLLDTITERLSALRQSFPSCKSLFTPGDLEFLRHLVLISERLKLFIEAREELVDVASIKDYEELMTRLLEFKDGFADFAVRKRVMKEIRELNEKLPGIRKQDDINTQSRTNARILDLNLTPAHCIRNHPMVIRKGQHGYFWGCTKYPFCKEMATLNRQQKDRLFA